MDHFRNDREGSDSVYSYSYRGRDKDAAVHDGDYRADRDDSDAKRFSGGGSYYHSGDDSRKNTYDPWTNGNTQGYGKRYSSDFAGKRNQKRKSGDHFFIKLVKCAVLAVVFGLVAGGVFCGINKIGKTKEDTSQVSQTESAQPETTKVSTQTQEESLVVSDISDIVDETMPSIVSITNISQTEYYNWYGQTQTHDSESCGSGIIVAQDSEYLYIATNNHVVSGASSLTICFFDDSTVAAEVKGRDSGSDLAVVSVKKSDLESDTLANIKIATMGDSDSLRVGQAAIAIGNALGYGQSVTTGVISALNRQVSITDSETGTTVTNELIQTDAAINPGNSGGALLNSRGEVIGINSVKYSDTTVEGMGYAIPVATASPIINELISREVVDSSQSAYLGIVGVDVTSDVASVYKMPEGIYIVQVSEGSAAEKAGLKKGDILISFDGHSLNSMDGLEEQLQYYAAGTDVVLVIQRVEQGMYQEKTISVTLDSKK